MEAFRNHNSGHPVAGPSGGGGASGRARRNLALGVAAASLAALSATALLSASEDSTTAPGTPGTRPVPSGALPPAAFSWLHPAPAPTGWTQATIASANATLSYPVAWTTIPGDSGTVTAALRDGGGIYHGYLNVTPRQGAERPNGWASFRTRRNRGEGDKRVRELAAAEHLRFRGAEGSCVIDDYLSRVRSHPYREIACIVVGNRGTDVFVGAALQRDWPKLGPVVERAASAFLER